MKAPLILTALTALLTTTTTTTTATAQYFSLIAARSGSPIHLLDINASGLRLYINRPTASYCPSSIATTPGVCPAGTTTEFLTGHGILFLGVVVPGGQSVYIDPVCGAVAYTAAHEETPPPGAVTGGWSKSEGPNFGTLSWDRGLLACPAPDGQGGWQVFAQLETLTFGGECLGFDALSGNSTQPGAWEYI